MKEIKPSLSKLIFWSSTLSILIYTLVLLFLHKALPWKGLMEVWLHIGLIIFPTLFIWHHTEKQWWRIPWYRKLLAQLMEIPPDIQGRWEGNLIRDNDQNVYSFKIEIYQTLSTFYILTFSDKGFSRSRSISCTIFRENPMAKNYKISYIWEAEASATPSLNLPESKFIGTSILEYVLSNPDHLAGAYFTNRSPNQTKGRIDLQRITSQLTGKS